MVFYSKIVDLLLQLFKNTFLFFLLGLISCGSRTTIQSQTPKDKVSPVNVTDTISETTQVLTEIPSNSIITGANQTELYLPLLKDKKVAIVGNQTSVIFKNPTIQPLIADTDNIPTKPYYYTHLVDSLLSRNIVITKVFAPEHGFRGKMDAAEIVSDGRDIRTGIPIISLYGKSKKPTPQALSDVDIVVFDIQDVGVRFYTYISTLHYVMQACAENQLALLVLDRPNPNAHYVDGPILEPLHQSFVGMHPVPLVHGMTIGEYAQMINGQGWLGDGLRCDLQIISIKNYTHDLPYSLPIRPSPNLPNDKAINLYPSLGFFEGTTINAGRGTEMQFQIFGSPDFPIANYDFAYTPQPNFGAKYPKHKGELCYGKDLRNIERLDSINLQWLLDAYQNCKDKNKFFNPKSFTAHAGTEILQKQIEQGLTHPEIRKTWLTDLEDFKKMREPYLLYE